MNDDQTTARVRIPRDRDNDYRDEMAATRRQFLTGQHRCRPRPRRPLLDRPGDAAGQHRELHRRRPGAHRVGRAAPINGEHAQGDFYVPLATTEGTLVASYSRGMRLLTECGGVRTTVVDDSMQRAPGVRDLDDALDAREFGEWIDEHFEEIKAAAESTTSVGRARSHRPVRGRSPPLPALQLHHR